jgi:hypothetical protein
LEEARKEHSEAFNEIVAGVFNNAMQRIEQLNDNMSILGADEDLSPVTVASALLANSKAYRVELETLFMVWDKTTEYIESKNKTTTNTPITQDDKDRELDDLFDAIREANEQQEEKKEKASIIIKR